MFALMLFYFLILKLKGPKIYYSYLSFQQTMVPSYFGGYWYESVSFSLRVFQPTQFHWYKNISAPPRSLGAWSYTPNHPRINCRSYDLLLDGFTDSWCSENNRNTFIVPNATGKIYNIFSCGPEVRNRKPFISIRTKIFTSSIKKYPEYWWNRHSVFSGTLPLEPGFQK